ncbi:hypothetical protein E3Q10_03905 [Wallemia mellicola]|uniref:Uncharacterized protein n=1 Tax=Wallemia mellicola TaxID=1708541 RepID=A0A4V4N5Q6_9BASI|nr:hypothetical protein E3Q15_04138 [Wallemia mellicola]TIC08403.1 hypothetical protein E3Q14_03968 [Wallemia mellicola]TIC24900.1 hypothetical protein E3Q10_03905 [Wallemia mellicola]TIC48947.1 hypothetical protein E3Q05_04003 [Wallemia mellicola]TIC73753.1 hypothetical protein E3Q00_02665 [Wallemia mellicola]
MTSSLLSALSIAIEQSLQPVHETFYPFPWMTTLHAARISLAFQAKSKVEAESNNAKRLNFAADLVGYLVMAWSGSIVISSILQQPYPQLLSVWPLVNYVTVHLFLRALPTPSVKVLDLSLPLLDAFLRSGALTGAINTCIQHSEYKNSLFAQFVVGTLAPSAGSLTASTLNVTSPYGWRLSTPYPLTRGAGLIGTLELWIATLSTLVYGVLAHSHSEYDIVSNTPTHTQTEARSIVILILCFAYTFKAVYVHIYLSNQDKNIPKSKEE